MRKNLGVHIIADLYECKFVKLKRLSLIDLKKCISQLIKKSGLTEIGSFYKEFGEASFSAVISLTESHLTFHTWPELDYISMDIFVCNFKKNNSKKATQLYEKLINFFQPKRINKRTIIR